MNTNQSCSSAPAGRRKVITALTESRSPRLVLFLLTGRLCPDNKTLLCSHPIICTLSSWWSGHLAWTSGSGHFSPLCVLVNWDLMECALQQVKRWSTFPVCTSLSLHKHSVYTSTSTRCFSPGCRKYQWKIKTSDKITQKQKCLFWGDETGECLHIKVCPMKWGTNERCVKRLGPVSRGSGTLSPDAGNFIQQGLFKGLDYFAETSLNQKEHKEPSFWLTAC